MSSNQDFVSKRPEDPMLSRMYTELPGLQPDTIPSHVVAAILWLDKARGIMEPDDYILLNASVAGWVMMEFEICDPEIEKARSAAALDTDNDEKSLEDFGELVAKPFMIRFSESDLVPSNIRDRQVAIAVMRDRDAEDWDRNGIYAVSLRADGSIVGQRPLYQEPAEAL